MKDGLATAGRRYAAPSVFHIHADDQYFLLPGSTYAAASKRKQVTKSILPISITCRSAPSSLRRTTSTCRSCRCSSTPEQTFVNGIELKEDLKKLDERYSALDPSELKEGPQLVPKASADDQTFLTTRLWDTHVPKWRDAPGPVKLNKQLQDAIMEVMQEVSGAQEGPSHNIASVKELGYVSMQGTILRSKGKYHRYSEEAQQRIIADETAP